MSDPAAFHEFAMFGRSRLYLSHYPMFHAVHAYQALAEARLRWKGRDVTVEALAEMARHPKRLYTLSPSRKGSPLSRRRADWRLPQAFRARSRFNADVHWGERKNQFLARDVTATLTRIIFFRQFQEGDKHNRRLTYLIFGDPDDLYLAHYVTVQPDFDQLVSAQLLSGPALRPFTTVSLARPDRHGSRLRKPGQQVQGTLARVAGPGPVSARQYPALTTGRDRSSARPARVRLRIGGELYYMEIDEEG